MKRYERERFVGRGACGSAYVCRRIGDSKRVVIKEIAIEMNESDREATLNEIKVLSMLHHPNIIEYYDSFLHDKSMMIVMEYAAGGTLFDLVESRAADQMSYLEEDEIAHLFAQIALPLHLVHSNNILHRDLKSKNIFLTASLDHVKIGDFGISKILSSKSKAYTVVGTPSYISPELCEGKPYNYKSDVWSLGCVLYEMCSLKRAFEAPNLPALVLKIMRGTVEPLPLRYSAGLRQLIASMLALNPADRPDLASLMAHHWLAPHVLRLPTCLGVLPCTARPPRPLSATRTEDLKISMRESSFMSTKQKSLFASGKTTTIFNGVIEGDKIEVESTDISDRDATDFVQVCLGQVDHHELDVIGVTKLGKIFHWKFHPHSRTSPKIRILDQLVSIRVVKVATGDGFMCMLTDRGILLSKGSGAGGCLGHGNEESAQKPKIVDALLGEEVIDVACGWHHVIALTSDADHPLHTWGTDKAGCLGQGTPDFVCKKPKHVPDLNVGDAERGEKVVCGKDVTAVVTNKGRIFITGNFHKMTQSEFVDQTPNYIAVSDVAFGRDYVVFLSTENRVFFERFGVNEEMLEVKSPKVKMISHFSSYDKNETDLLLLSTFDEDVFLVRLIPSSASSSSSTSERKSFLDPDKIASTILCNAQDNNPERRLLPASVISISAARNAFCAVYSTP